jgi:cystathionine gamma-lyase
MTKITKKQSPRTLGFATRAIHGRQSHDKTTGAVIPPIFATSTFAQSSPGVHTGWEYARSQNPTRAAFEAALAELEGGSSGFAFASGLAAENAILELLEHGSHIVASDDLYGGTWRLFHRVRAQSSNLAVTHVDFSDPAAVEAAITPRTALLWVETPSNPLLKLADLSAIATIGKKHNILTVADNTFASPAIQRPLQHGFSLVVHSVTKYIGGHSDIIGGAIVTADDSDLQSRIGFIQNATGGILDPFSSFLGLRGIKTLQLRVARHSANALVVARWLEDHPAIERVVYPGLPSHPQHSLALSQMQSGGGMISAFLKATPKQTIKALENFKIFALAESLGGVESLVGHPVSMSHGSIPEKRREALGITANLIRLSIGIEDPEDLIFDLDQALARRS